MFFSEKKEKIVKAEVKKEEKERQIPDSSIKEEIKEPKGKDNLTRNQRDNFIIQMENYFKSANMIDVLAKWKTHLLIIVVIAALLAALFSMPFFITPLYKSYAVVYPANVESYSEESETEQMLQILNSQDITDSIIEKFNLAKHYDINPEYKYFRTALLNEYKEKVSISKTPYESVRIEVLDQNPDTAALMVDAVIHYYDKKVSDLHKSKYAEVIDMYDKQLQKKRNTLDSLKNRMIKLGTEHGIIQYEYESQEIMRGYLKTVYGSNASHINTKEVDRLFKNMQNYGGELVELVRMIEEEATSYVSIKEDYELALRFYNSDLTYSNIVSHPFPADKKAYPIRWLIVIVVALATFVLATLVIFILESWKKS